MIEKSKNQYSSNIIALSFFNKAPDKAPNNALDKALIKHTTKQGESTDSIIKLLTSNIELLTKNYKQVDAFINSLKKKNKPIDESVIDAIYRHNR